MIEPKEISEPTEWYYLFIQIIFASLTAILNVVFTTNNPIVFYGDHWWASIVILAIVILVFALYYVIRGFAVKEIFERILITLISSFIISLIVDSLWIYGTFIWTGYFSSAEAFFGGIVMLSIISCFATSGLFSIIIPTLYSKETKVSSKNVIKKIDECKKRKMDYDPNTNSCVPKL